MAQRVKEVRKRRGWTAAQLAERCAEIGAPQLTAQAIANIENGRKDKATGRRRRDVTVDELLALAVALDVAPVHLLVPVDKGGAYWVTSKGMTRVALVRQWVRGREPFPKGNRRVYFSEVPEEEWEAPAADWSGMSEADWRKLADLAEQHGLLGQRPDDDRTD